MTPSNLIAYEDAIVLGRLSATVTDSGISVAGQIRSSRVGDFGHSAARLLTQLAFDAGDEEVSGLAADVFDTTLTQGWLGETGHVRFIHASGADEPTLPARRLLLAVARRVAIRWPYRP